MAYAYIKLYTKFSTGICMYMCKITNLVIVAF